LFHDTPTTQSPAALALAAALAGALAAVLAGGADAAVLAGALDEPLVEHAPTMTAVTAIADASFRISMRVISSSSGSLTEAPPERAGSGP